MSEQTKKRLVRIGLVALTMCFATFLLLGCSGGSSKSSSSSSASSSASSSTSSSAKAQSQPANGTILDGSSNGNAGVEVHASSDASVYVKVKTTSGSTVVGFYVRAGSTASVDVPTGTYNIQFASGKTWYGTSGVFGSGTSYGQDPSVTLDYGDVIEYTLQPVSNGNFAMSSLDGSRF